MGQFRKYPALADRLRAIGIELQGRDVVQPRLEGHEEVSQLLLLAPRGAEPTLDDPLMESFENVLESPFAFERRGMQEIHLGNLSQRASVQLVRQVLGDDVDEDLARKLAARAGGNFGQRAQCNQRRHTPHPPLGRPHWNCPVPAHPEPPFKG